MADEKLISPSEFSSCELRIKIDGNELNIPINFGMSDDEVRKLYPYMLKISRMEDNPLPALLAKKEAGEFDGDEAAYDETLRKTEELARYWYDKPTSSLLDIGIGIAIDLYMRNGLIDVGPFKVDPNITSMFESAPAIDNAKPAAADEIDAVERVYGLVPDSDGKLTINDELQMHTDIAGGIFSMYGDDGKYDFVSEQLSELEKKNGVDRFEELLSKETFDESRYASTYDPTAPLDMSEIGENGLLNIYGDSEPSSVFDRLDAEEDGDDAEEEPVTEPKKDEHKQSAVKSLDDAMAALLADEEPDEGEPWYDDIDEVGLEDNIDESDDEGV